MIFLIICLGATAVILLCYELLMRRERMQRKSRIRTKMLARAHATRSNASGCSGDLRGDAGGESDAKCFPVATDSSTAGIRPRAPTLMWSQKLVELGAPLPIVGPLIRRGQNQHLLISCQADLPRMLEILAMAMRAGLSFDAAFGLYVSRFDNPLSRVCAERFDVWNKGLISREDGLRKLASTLDIPLLSRFVSTTIRALHYGAPLAPLLEDCATEARRIYRDSQREKVAKAPVKMLIPTGTLILPAMLMLVIGPIILNVTERMV